MPLREEITKHKTKYGSEQREQQRKYLYAQGRDNEWERESGKNDNTVVQQYRKYTMKFHLVVAVVLALDGNGAVVSQLNRSLVIVVVIYLSIFPFVWRNFI